jgi:hypothetical protein
MSLQARAYGASRLTHVDDTKNVKRPHRPVTQSLKDHARRQALTIVHI